MLYNIYVLRSIEMGKMRVFGKVFPDWSKRDEIEKIAFGKGQFASIQMRIHQMITFQLLRQPSPKGDYLTEI
jgi:hypothetical protein